MNLEPAGTPAFLKLGVFGHTGCGKTYTCAKLLSQFIAEFEPGKQLAMFDTEGGAEYVAPLVQEITGKPLLVVHSDSFGDLLLFAAACREAGHVAFCDSITHPWRKLVEEFLVAKRSRVSSVGGNPDRVNLSLKDWGPLKEIWAKFSTHLRYDPVHWCICGREGDVWEERENEEGDKELYKAGVKMKTEGEMGYEPSLLVRMVLEQNPPKATVHRATVVKDRFDVLTGHSADDPDLEFFRPHIERLSIGGRAVKPIANPAPAFTPSSGPNFETIQARRAAVLENVKDDLMIAYPGQTAAEKKAKVTLLREAFGTSSWTELEKDYRAFPEDALIEGRTKLKALIAEKEEVPDA